MIGASPPGRMPNSRRRSRRACSTVTCTRTSGLARSMSRMIFSATATLSGVSRMTMGVWEDHDGIGGDRFPEGLGHQSDNVECLLQGGVDEFDRDAPGLKLGIE